MKRKFIGLALAAAVVGLPLAVKFSGAKPSREAELVRVEEKEIHPSILASGNLVFRQEVQLSSEVIGKVSEMLVKEGDRVEKGQVLLRLDPSSYRAEVAQQEANRRNAEIAIERAQLNVANQQRSLDRNKRLADAKFIDVSKYDDAVLQEELAEVELRASRQSLLQATALLSQANERLAKTEVRAPITGTATAVQIKLGETAVASATGIAGSSLMTIADVGSIMAEVNVDEADIARVAQGQRAQVFPSAFPDQPVVGTVETVSMTPKTGAQGRSYVVKLRLADNALALRTGMTCRVDIVVGGSSAKPVLPIQAILSDDNRATDGAKDTGKVSNYVLAVVDGVVRKRAVEVGAADDTNQEVLKGLALGDTVAAGPARTLRELHDGDRVSPLKPAQVAATAAAPPPPKRDTPALNGAKAESKAGATAGAKT